MNNNKATKKLYIKTYGCQMNVYDSIKMAELLAPFGYVETTGLYFMSGSIEMGYEVVK